MLWRHTEQDAVLLGFSLGQLIATVALLGRVLLLPSEVLRSRFSF